MQFPDLVDYTEWGLLALRVVMGVIFVVHGWPKITGARGMAEMMAGGSGAAVAVFTLQGIVETLGGIFLAIGFLTQIVAILFGLIMIAAIGLKMVQMKTGFSAQQTTGWEFDLVLLAGSVLLLFSGPGGLAVQA